jgi:hypothetical protein
MSGGVWVGLTLLGGCDMVADLMGSAGPELAEPAEARLRAGDLPGAATAYAELYAANPTHWEVATGHAYLRLLAGDTAGADAALEGLEEGAGERLSEVKLRRALVALEAKDDDRLDRVKAHAMESKLPAARLLAAEVRLLDLETEEASRMLRDLVSEPGPVGAAATAYLKGLDSGDQIQAGLAEAAALWALGDRVKAVENAQELVGELPGDSPDRFDHGLVWSGRAATSGRPDVAAALLADAGPPTDPSLSWRIPATEAIIAAARGSDEAVQRLDQLAQAGAPSDGLADARATACAVATSADLAARLVTGLDSAAAARCLMLAGASDAAKAAVSGGLLDTYLENR